jgi:hypothetical protein
LELRIPKRFTDVILKDAPPPPQIVNSILPEWIGDCWQGDKKTNEWTHLSDDAETVTVYLPIIVSDEAPKSLFDPDQPRDEEGRWAAAGASHEFKPDKSKLTAEEKAQINDDYQNGRPLSPMRGADGELTGPPPGYLRVYRGVNPQRNETDSDDDTHGYWYATTYDTARDYANWEWEGDGLRPGAAVLAVDVSEDDAFAFAQSGSRRKIESPDELYDEDRAVELLVNDNAARKAVLYEGDESEGRKGRARNLYSDDQPRDEGGRWTAAGASGRFASMGDAQRDSERIRIEGAFTDLGMDLFIEKEATHLQLASRAHAVLTEMKAKGYKLPDGLYVKSDDQDAPHAAVSGAGADRALLLYLPKALPPDADLDEAASVAFDGTVSATEVGLGRVGSAELTPNQEKAWESHPDPLYSAYDRFAPRSMRDVIVHEMAHVQTGHRGQLNVAELLNKGTFRSTLDIKRAMMRVSQYAASDGQDEFIAETFVRLYRGDEVPEDSMKLYRALNGPEVK